MRGCATCPTNAQIILCSDNVIHVYSDYRPRLLHAALLFPQRDSLVTSVDSDVELHSNLVVVRLSHFLGSLCMLLNHPTQDLSEIANE